jgi:large subunit ribosomal protein L30
MATLKITQVCGGFHATDRQQATLRSLKLGKINRSVEREDGPVVNGMVKSVSHLVKVEKV